LFDVTRRAAGVLVGCCHECLLIGWALCGVMSGLCLNAAPSLTVMKHCLECAPRPCFAGGVLSVHADRQLQPLLHACCASSGRSCSVGCRVMPALHPHVALASVCVVMLLLAKLGMIISWLVLCICGRLVAVLVVVTWCADLLGDLVALSRAFVCCRLCPVSGSCYAGDLTSLALGLDTGAAAVCPARASSCSCSMQCFR
jgi:hypothetical protein